MAAGTVADAIVETLARAGVRRVYGVPSDSLGGLLDALAGRADVAFAHVRHGEAGAFAAAAEASLTGRLAVCAAGSGPGQLRMLNGLYDCQRSRVPVLAIAAHVPTREIGTCSPRETDAELLFRDCSWFCAAVVNPAQLPGLLDVAILTAVARSGVAVLVLPSDVALAPAAGGARRVHLAPEPPTVAPPAAVVAEAARLLNAGRRVTILAGAGCRDAHDALVALAETLAAPVVHTIRGKEFVAWDAPHDVGMTGLLGFSSGYLALLHCDTLLMLGTDFPYPQLLPERACTIQVDLRHEHLGRRTRLDLGLVGDVRTTLEALRPHLAAKRDRTHLEECLAHYRRTLRDLDELARPQPQAPIHPQYVVRTLDRLAADDAVFTCDTGTPSVWAARYLTMNGRRRLLGSFTHGAMGAALPQAIGAQLVDPGRQVVSLCGDGGLAMLLGELLTLRQLQLAVKVLVFDNAALGLLRARRPAARVIELVNPDFAAIAEAAGLRGIAVARTEQVEPALAAALRHEGPALVHLRVDRQELVLPPSLELEAMGDVGLFMAKAVLNRFGNRLVDLEEEELEP